MDKQTLLVDVEALMTLVRRLPASKAQAILDTICFVESDQAKSGLHQDQLPGPQPIASNQY